MKRMKTITKGIRNFIRNYNYATDKMFQYMYMGDDNSGSNQKNKK